MVLIFFVSILYILWRWMNRWQVKFYNSYVSYLYNFIQFLSNSGSSSFQKRNLFMLMSKLKCPQLFCLSFFHTKVQFFFKFEATIYVQYDVASSSFDILRILQTNVGCNVSGTIWIWWLNTNGIYFDSQQQHSCITGIVDGDTLLNKLVELGEVKEDIKSKDDEVLESFKDIISSRRGTVRENLQNHFQGNNECRIHHYFSTKIKIYLITAFKSRYLR